MMISTCSEVSRAGWPAGSSLPPSEGVLSAGAAGAGWLLEELLQPASSMMSISIANRRESTRFFMFVLTFFYKIALWGTPVSP